MTTPPPSPRTIRRSRKRSDDIFNIEGSPLWTKPTRHGHKLISLVPNNPINMKGIVGLTATFAALSSVATAGRVLRGASPPEHHQVAIAIAPLVFDYHEHNGQVGVRPVSRLKAEVSSSPLYLITTSTAAKWTSVV
ncbi:hypothetical protein H257_09132 [Aphanomyces astaci]|uniref:Uncharacterized protein n=1 Tax=Aphanomyces astaci TaxID=112090 RepID=W4GBJ0_APHAT|nr:hypothetical protein H257_09132 [Aphanomyces astaci]ETV76641.1 hypothetical protein H257_09132 [Aphanomyces astaci]|eukprot:XP_009833553.1 hypothetical protein H257_09132 [Aphanomyces astaci]